MKLPFDFDISEPIPTVISATFDGQFDFGCPGLWVKDSEVNFVVARREGRHSSGTADDFASILAGLSAAIAGGSPVCFVLRRPGVGLVLGGITAGSLTLGLTGCDAPEEQ